MHSYPRLIARLSDGLVKWPQNKVQKWEEHDGIGKFSGTIQ